MSVESAAVNVVNAAAVEVPVVRMQMSLGTAAVVPAPG